MRIKIDILEILSLASHHLKSDFEGCDPNQRRYQMFLIANAISIACRQTINGQAEETEELNAYTNLLKNTKLTQDEPYQALPTLCDCIRSGAFDPGSENHLNLFKVLSTAAFRLVSECNPKYLSDKKN